MAAPHPLGAAPDVAPTAWASAVQTARWDKREEIYFAAVRERQALRQQLADSASAALETTEKMTERARLMFLTLPNGPHSSGMPGCRVRATNGTLELVAKVAHTCWTAHKDEIRTMCPQLWDEELLRGWLLMDSLAQRPKAELAARTVGKRAATQVWTANARAKGEVKKARNKAAPEARDEAAEAATPRH